MLPPVLRLCFDSFSRLPDGCLARNVRQSLSRWRLELHFPFPLWRGDGLSRFAPSTQWRVSSCGWPLWSPLSCFFSVPPHSCLLVAGVSKGSPCLGSAERGEAVGEGESTHLSAGARLVSSSSCKGVGSSFGSGAVSLGVHAHLALTQTAILSARAPFDIRPSWQGSLFERSSGL